MDSSDGIVDESNQSIDISNSSANNNNDSISPDYDDSVNISSSIIPEESSDRDVSAQQQAQPQQQQRRPWRNVQQSKGRGTGIVLNAARIKQCDDRQQRQQQEDEELRRREVRSLAVHKIARLLVRIIRNQRVVRAAVNIQATWLSFKHNREIRYTVHGQLSKRQSDVLFGFLLGWKVRHLLKKKQVAAKVRAVRETQNVLVDVCKANLKCPPCLLTITQFVTKTIDRDMGPPSMYAINESDWKFMRTLARQLLVSLSNFHSLFFGNSCWCRFPPPGYLHLQIFDGGSALSLVTNVSSNRSSPRSGVVRTPPQQVIKQHQHEHHVTPRGTATTSNRTSPRVSESTPRSDRDDTSGAEDVNRSIFATRKSQLTPPPSININTINDSMSSPGGASTPSAGRSRPLMDALQDNQEKRQPAAGMMEEQVVADSARSVSTASSSSQRPSDINDGYESGHSGADHQQPVIIDERPIRPMTANAWEEYEVAVNSGQQNTSKGSNSTSTPSSSSHSRSRSLTPTSSSSAHAHVTPTASAAAEAPSSSSSHRKPAVVKASIFNASSASTTTPTTAPAAGKASTSQRKGPKPHIQLDVISAEKLMLAKKGPSTRDSQGEILADRQPGLRISMFLPSAPSNVGSSSSYGGSEMKKVR
jgi:hypothetical protein